MIKVISIAVRRGVISSFQWSGMEKSWGAKWTSWTSCRETRRIEPSSWWVWCSTRSCPSWNPTVWSWACPRKARSPALWTKVNFLSFYDRGDVRIHYVILPTLMTVHVTHIWTNKPSVQPSLSPSWYLHDAPRQPVPDKLVPRAFHLLRSLSFSNYIHAMLGEKRERKNAYSKLITVRLLN